MKKHLPILFLLVITFLGFNKVSKAQCPGCTIDYTCMVSGGGLCPDSLPGATQGIYYDEDVTSYLPSVIDAGPFSNGVLGIVPLVSVKINSISGLPFGLNWQSNKANNTYYPSSGENHGCVKICGTPLSAPGIYNIIVNVTATVDAGSILGLQTSQIDFNFQMVLFPGTSGNLAYNFSPSSACDSGTFNFTPNLSASLPQTIEYIWNFGSSTYNGLNPPDIDFLAPGNYPVTTTVNYYDLKITSVSVSLTPGVDCWFAGDIEELNCSNGNVDFYFTYNSGSYNYTSPTISDNANATWNSLNLPINGLSFSMNFFDDDNGPPFGSPDDNGGLFTGTLTGPGTFNFSTVAISSGGGGTTGSYTVSQVLSNTIVVTDTIKVYASPSAPTATLSTTSICKGDSALLSTSTTGYTYEWYKNGLLIPNSNVQQLYVNDTGNYFVRIIDPVSGCYNNSNTVYLNFYPAVPSNFAISLNSSTGVLQSNLSGSYSYQWMYNPGSGWVNIPAPAGVQSTYTPTANGQYMLIATTPNGCSDTSNVLTLNNVGINDIASSLNLSIFPVPTNDVLNIQMNLKEFNDISVRLFDLVGKVVIQEQWNQQQGWVNNQLHLQQLPAGTYFLDIETKYGQIRRKIVKQ